MLADFYPIVDRKKANIGTFYDGLIAFLKPKISKVYFNLAPTVSI